MTAATRTVPATDTTALSVTGWVPETPPEAVVQIVHGMAEHAGRYARLAEALNAAGYAVYADDHRGHGKTAGELSRAGVLAPAHGWSVVVHDLRTITEHIRAEHPGVPVFMLGHSMGSLLARDYAMRYGCRLNGLLLTGTVGPMAAAPAGRLLARIEARRHGRATPSPLLDRLCFGANNKPFEPARTPFDWLSRDAAEVDRYVADEWCGFLCSAGFFDDLLGGIERVNRRALIRRVPASLPVWIASGSQDPLAKGGRTVQVVAAQYRAAGLTDVTATVYPGARHEVFNELNRDQITRDVVRWLDAHSSLSA